MAFFYKSLRVGKGGKVFTMWKIRTLKDGTDKVSSFASNDQYLPLGRFLRRTHLDELPNALSLLNGNLALVGPRSEEAKSINVLPQEIKKILLSVRPGLTSLASLAFFDESQILEKATDPHRIYWERIKPAKILLDVFYIQHRCLSLDLVILWLTFKKILHSIWSR